MISALVNVNIFNRSLRAERCSFIEEVPSEISSPFQSIHPFPLIAFEHVDISDKRFCRNKTRILRLLYTGTCIQKH